MTKIINPTENRFIPEKGENKNTRIYRPNDDVMINRVSEESSSPVNKNINEDAKVNISEAIKDFSKIKKTVDNSPEIDNSEKISLLKDKIDKGIYKIDFNELADKMLDKDI